MHSIPDQETQCDLRDHYSSTKISESMFVPERLYGRKQTTSETQFSAMGSATAAMNTNNAFLSQDTETERSFKMMGFEDLQHDAECEPRKHFLEKIQAPLRCLRLFGCFPEPIPTRVKPQKLTQSSVSINNRKTRLILRMYSFGLITYCSYYAYLNFVVTIRYAEKQTRGILDGYVMASVVTGILPVQCGFNLIIFATGVAKHVVCLQRIDALSNVFISPKNISLVFIVVSIVIVAPSALIRVTSMFGWPEYYFGSWFDLYLMILVPCFRFMQLLPLSYFAILCYILQKWFEKLKHQISRERHPNTSLLSYYYETFDRLASASKSVSDFLSPFILISIITSVTILGLCAYFLTSAGDIITIPEGLTNTSRPNSTSDYIRKYIVLRNVNISYAILQLITAIAYILTICHVGRKARWCVGAALQLSPLDGEGRFLVIKFNNRLATQLAWGISVWRSFLVERSLLFTVFV